MFWPTRLKPLLAMFLITACTDGIGPDPVVQSSDPETSRDWPELNILGVNREYANTPPQACLRLGLESWAAPCPRAEILPNLAPPAELSGTFEASFWAVAGEDRVLQIGYEYGGETYPLLMFEVEEEALYERPDGTRFSDGDSVLIDVSLDLTRLLATFEPSGLRFSNEDPAIFTFWYDAAGGDLNGDGVVDGEDAEIEDALLGLWTQQLDRGSWDPVGAGQATSENLFEASIYHFTNYAVGW